MNTARKLSEDLRHGRGEFLAQRRWAALLSLTTISSMMLITLYQVGILKHLPEPPLPKLDTDKVNGSDQAYSMLALPDAVLGLGSYAATLGLVAMGGHERARTLAGKALVAAVQAGKLTRDSWLKHRAFSIYSLVAAAATLATLPLVAPEAAAAFRSWKRGRPPKPDRYR